MESAKEKMWEIIKAQPEDSSFDDILKELALARMVDRGMEDVRAGRVIDNDEMKRRVCKWQT